MPSVRTLRWLRSGMVLSWGLRGARTLRAGCSTLRCGAALRNFSGAGETERRARGSGAPWQKPNGGRWVPWGVGGVAGEA
eukprot:8609355-Alexandrium_andersonii.AAC.1